MVQPLTLECYLYGGDSQPSRPYFKCKNMDNQHIAAWLRGGSPKTWRDDGDRGPPTAALRLVWVTHEYSMVHPFGRATQQEVHHILGIPPEKSPHLLGLGGLCGKYSVTATESVYISYRSTSNRTSSFVIKHDSASNLTTGYVLLGATLAPEMDDMLEAVQSQFPFFPHPLLVPTIVSEATAYSATHLLTQLHGQLRDNVEKNTGFANWDDDHGRPGRTKSDFPALTRELGEVSFDSAFVDLAVRTTLLRVEFMLTELGVQVPAFRAGSVESLMRQRLEFLKSRLEHLLVHGAIKERIQAQQTVLFNLIAQQDSSLNISIASDSRELAAASKRDSSSMKIIAILTTLFLPGTFVAALFAMPMFDWEASSVSEASEGSHLWFYWAVTIPLTALVMGTFGLYAWYQGRERKNEWDAEKARESIRDRVRKGDKRKDI